MVKKLILFIALLSNFSFAIIQELIDDAEIAEKQNSFFFESSVMAIYQQFNEEYIHSENSIDMKYSGFGPLIDFRVGVFIKGRVALFGNIFFEITDGYYDGVVDEENDEIVEKHIKKSAIAYGNGAGIQFFPLTSLSNDFANLYLGGSISVFMGGVENIGGFCGGFNLFLGNQ